MWTSLKKSTERSLATPATINYVPIFHNGGSAPVFNTTGTAPVTINNNRNQSPFSPLRFDGESDDEATIIDDLELLDNSTGKGERDGWCEEDDVVSNTPTSVVPPHFADFKAAYSNTEGHRWKLSSGRDVETTL